MSRCFSFSPRARGGRAREAGREAEKEPGHPDGKAGRAKGLGRGEPWRPLTNLRFMYARADDEKAATVGAEVK